MQIVNAKQNLSFLRKQESSVFVLEKNEKRKDTGSSIKNVEDDKTGSREKVRIVGNARLERS